MVIGGGYNGAGAVDAWYERIGLDDPAIGFAGQAVFIVDTGVRDADQYVAWWQLILSQSSHMRSNLCICPCLVNYQRSKRSCHLRNLPSLHNSLSPFHL
ncbi:hypothetical protein D1872_290950 [compost metagenome]